MLKESWQIKRNQVFWSSIKIAFSFEIKSTCRNGKRDTCSRRFSLSQNLQETKLFCEFVCCSRRGSSHHGLFDPSTSIIFAHFHHEVQQLVLSYGFLYTISNSFVHAIWHCGLHRLSQTQSRPSQNKINFRSFLFVCLIIISNQNLFLVFFLTEGRYHSRLGPHDPRPRSMQLSRLSKNLFLFLNKRALMIKIFPRFNF